MAANVSFRRYERLMNTELARTNMLMQQIRAWGVLEDKLLSVIAEVDRARFVPEAYRDFAYADMAIPLGYGQEMLSPCVEARLLQAASPRPKDKVLEIGTGSGYFTALLASEGATVVSVELIPELSRRAQGLLADHKHISLAVGNAAYGWAEGAPYDMIVITGALSTLAPQFAEQLHVGGRLIAMVGRDVNAQKAFKFVRTKNGLTQTELFTTRTPYLLEGPGVETFTF